MSIIKRIEGKKYPRGIAGEVMIYSCTLCGAKSSLLGYTHERMEHLAISHNVTDKEGAMALTMTVFEEWRACEIYEDD
jgi:hypothetical protein